MASPHSAFGFLLGRGFTPDPGNPHFPLLQRLQNLREVGLLTIGPSGAAISVISKKAKEWEYSKVEEYLVQSDFPDFPEGSLEKLKENSGKGHVCVGVGFSSTPSLVKVAARMEDFEEMRALANQPQKAIEGYSLADHITPVLVRNPRHPSAILIPIQKDHVSHLLEKVKDFGLAVLRIQSSGAGLMEMVASHAEVISGKSHFAILDHNSATFVEVSDDGNWVKVFNDPEAGRNQGQGLNDFFAKVAKEVPRKPVAFLPSTRAQTDKLDIGVCPFPFASDERISPEEHPAAKALLQK